MNKIKELNAIREQQDKAKINFQERIKNQNIYWCSEILRVTTSKVCYTAAGDAVDNINSTLNEYDQYLTREQRDLFQEQLSILFRKFKTFIEQWSSLLCDAITTQTFEKKAPELLRESATLFGWFLFLLPRFSYQGKAIKPLETLFLEYDEQKNKENFKISIFEERLNDIVETLQLQKQEYKKLQQEGVQLDKSIRQQAEKNYRQANKTK